MYARSSAAATGRVTSAGSGRSGSSTSMTASSAPSNRDRIVALVIAATGVASSSMNSSRASGIAGSMGR